MTANDRQPRRIALLSSRIRTLHEIFRRPALRRAMALAQFALFAGVVVFLVRQLSKVGWTEVAGSLPSSPFFYLIFTIRYFALPLMEIPAYEIVWRRPLWRHFSAFIRKRVYNFAVMGYSGEAFFTLWARRTLDLSDRDVIVGVKDNNLISALVSNLATAILVAVLFFSGALIDDLKALPGAPAIFGVAFLSASVLAAAVIILRRKVINLAQGVMARVVAINMMRIALVLGLHALLYSSAIPGPPISAWLMLIALQLVLSRLPFVPNPDIVFLTAALHLAGDFDAPQVRFAGMLVAEAGLAQLFNAALFAATAHLAWSRRDGTKPAPPRTAAPS